MGHVNIRSLEDAGRATTVWDNEAFATPSRFGDIVTALLPASLILAAATALMLALL